MMWTLDTEGTPPLWRPSDSMQAAAAFTTRRGGVSDGPFSSLNLGRSTDDRPEAVEENRRRVLAALGLTPAVLVTAGQVHGTTVQVADRAGHLPGCDALITRTPGLALAVTTADCVPLILLAPGAAGAVHTGWRGTADGMPAAAVRALEGLGAAAESITVHVGPCIRECCYEVGEEVASRFPSACVRPAEGRWRLDLVLAARLQLRASGISDDSIHDTGACTACQANWYFSHRRDGSPSGRHWAVATVPATSRTRNGAAV